MLFQPFTIGKYEFVEVLGQGGMAEVYRVRTQGEKGFEKEFAIKRVLARFMTDPNMVRLFEEEARLTSILTHSNIVQVYEFLKSGGDYFLVMEYIKGKNLGASLRYLRSKGVKLRLDISLYIMNEVCKGLHYAHTKKDPKSGKLLNIIHRDISPQNIMISHEGDVKLVDFGIAKAMGDRTETATGSLAGKIAYMSPEQARGKKLDFKSDIFSLSLVFFEMLVQRKLFEGHSDLEVLNSVQNFDPDQYTSEFSEFPLDITAIIKKGLNPLPRLRYGDVSELQVVLQRYLTLNFPEMNQWNFSKWMNENCDLLSHEEKKAETQIAPISAGQEKLMEDALGRLEEVFQKGTTPSEKRFLEKQEPERTRVSRSRQEAPPPQSHYGGVLSVGAAILALVGIFMVFKNQIFQSIAPQPRVEVVETKPAPPIAVIPPPMVSSVPQEAQKVSAEAPVTSPAPPVAKTEPPKPVIVEPSPVKAVAQKPEGKPRKQPVAAPPRTAVAAKKTEPVKPAAPPPAPIDAKAQTEYERLLSSSEKDPVLKPAEGSKKLYEMALQEYKKGDYREAIINFRKSRTLKPSYLPSWIYEIMSLEAAGRTDEAKLVANEILKLRPETKTSPVLRKYAQSK